MRGQYGAKRMDPPVGRIGPGAARRKEVGRAAFWKMEVLGRGWREMEGIVVGMNGLERKA